ncbi:hypothetical protein G6F22_018890 [Rhizopus arrhizus]|nr:hypothetical protein G6F23_014133 [Rhizopus arrhizus]KAG0761372.1 hypothetical protein G6F22_018890 [Rhizopus arrhizus]KAG1172139.1 hypothetical protein G6F35_016960 [Rhizopus arrhizus]
MSYISALNLLEDTSVDISENTLGEEELALWANAQFTFDVQPGSEAKLFNDQDFYAPIAPAPVLSNHKVISSSVPMPSKKKQTAKLKDAIISIKKENERTNFKAANRGNGNEGKTIRRTSERFRKRGSMA